MLSAAADARPLVFARMSAPQRDLGALHQRSEIYQPVGLSSTRDKGQRFALSHTLNGWPLSDSLNTDESVRDGEGYRTPAGARYPSPLLPFATCAANGGLWGKRTQGTRGSRAQAKAHV